jgi:RNA polymerase sigma-70 factor (ECF subfamily)
MEMTQEFGYRESVRTLEELRAESDLAFGALVQRQERFAFRVAYALLRNSADAEDAAQEAFLKIYRKRAWVGVDDERGFLARVVWRTARDRQRQPKPAESGTEPDALATPQASPEAEAILAGQMQRIHRLIDGLPAKLREPLVLASLEELNSRQIAAALGIPEGTVRTRIQRARQELKRKLAAGEGARHGKG